MKTSILKNELLAELKKLKLVVNTKTSLPILKQAKLKVDSEFNFSITVTDLDNIVTANFSGKGFEQGECLIDFTRLYALVETANKGSIRIEKFDDTLLITGENESPIKLVIDGDLSEYPSVEFGESKEIDIMFSSELYKHLLPHYESIANDDPRVFLNGMLFEKVDGKLVMVSTDGYTLLHSTVDCKGEMEQIIVTRQAIKLFIACTKKDDSCTVLSVSKGNYETSLDYTSVKFECGNITAWSRLIDGDYPDYNMVIPRESDKTFCANPKSLVKTLVKIEKVGKTLDSYNGCFVLKSIGNEVSFNLREFGKNVMSQIVESDITWQNDLKAVYSTNYFKRYLSKTVAKEVELSFTDELSPCSIKSDGFHCVIMPVRIS